MTLQTSTSDELLLLCHLLLRAGKSSLFFNFDCGEKVSELFRPLTVSRAAQVVSASCALCPSCGKLITTSAKLRSFWFTAGTCCGGTTNCARVWSLPLFYSHFPAEVQEILYNIVLSNPYEPR
jgi:hypothetical protein